MSEAEYLAFEETSPEKHEFAGGQIFLMAGTSKQHNLISLNIAFLFRQKAKSCSTFMADVKSGVITFITTQMSC